MKVIRPIILFFSLCSHTFGATWTTTNCSSSDGAIKWEEGTAKEGVELRYANFVEGTLDLSAEQVNISLLKTFTYSEELYKDITIDAVKKVTVARALITASEKHPDVLQGQFPDNKVEGDVICTSISVSQK